MSNSEFTFVGQKVEKITLVFGLAMTIWGAVVTIISESQSLTSLIPSAIGLPMLIVGYLAIRYEHKKSFFYAYCCSYWFNNVCWRRRLN